MKKIFVLIAFTAFFALNAQVTANRFFYELTYKPKKDSAKLEKVMTVLDVVKDKSIYRDYTLIAQDSILKIQVEAMQKAGTFKDISKSITMPKFSEKIYKFYPSMKLQYVERVANGFTPMNIGYNEDLKLVWKIQAGKEKIGAYDTQKATTEYGGRKWTAWFTTAIPLQDGPYKFHGLPGLIVKLEDRTKTHQFELIGVSKFTPNPEKTSEFIGKNKEIEINQKQYRKIFLENRNDPSKVMKQAIANGAIIQLTDPNGNKISTAEMIKKREQNAKSKNAKDNNIIEIDLLQ